MTVWWKVRYAMANKLVTDEATVHCTKRHSLHWTRDVMLVALLSH
jgi:hypothetical protein